MVKPRSIRKKFTTSMLIILFVQAIFFACTIIFGGALKSINNNAYDSLIETTNLRKAAIESKLNSDATLLNNYNGIITTHLQSVADRYNRPLSDLSVSHQYKLEIIDSVVGDLTNLTKYENVTGAYILLCDSDELDTITDYYNQSSTSTNSNTITAGPSLTGLYLREGSDNVSDTGALQVLIGDNSILNKYSLGRYTYWTSDLSIEKLDNINFITQPVTLGINNLNVPTSGLGYWSHPYIINFSKNKVISYSLPLRDSANTTYGIIGIEMDINKLISNLPYNELNPDGHGSYVIAGSTETPNIYTRIVSSGTNIDKLNKYSDTLEYSEKPSYENIYTFSPKKTTLSTVYSTLDELDIYSYANYNHERWILSGILEGSHLLVFANAIKLNVIFSFAITVLASILFAYLLSYIFARPINKFISEVKEIRPDNPITPKPTNITEINELGDSIESLTMDLTDFSAKASMIINMAGLSIGAFEYDPKSNVVFCTDTMFNLLNMDNSENPLFVPRKVFEEKVSIFLKKIEPNINQIFKFTNSNSGISKWILFKTLDNHGKILGIVRDVTSETVAQHKRTHERDHDSMTALLNRIAFRKNVEKRADIKRVPVAAFILINLDNLSVINQKYGTTTGDNYIKATAQILNRLTDKKFIAARMAGDEFMVYIEGRTKPEVEAVISKLTNMLYSAKIGTPKGLINIEASTGISWFPEHGQNTDTLIQYAQFAMSMVKNSTKNATREFNQAEYAEATKALRTKEGFDQVLKNKLIRYAFQPIVNCNTGEIYGYEALMRPAENTHMSPSDIINFATIHNKLHTVEHLTWFTALENYTNQVDHLSTKKIFINSIPNQLLSTDDFYIIEQNYADYLENIVLEIIENEQTDENTITFKKALVDKWNCMLALDDYGSGYANDNTLLSLKPNIIKLDMDLITGIEDDIDRQTLVSNMISYAHDRGIIVLAEGIESRIQMEKIMTLGVDLLQGFYLAMPNFTIEDSISEIVKKEIMEIKATME